MHTFHQLPSDLFYEIALHLPLTKDVLAFALTSSRIRGALSTPGLFKARLALRGWDITAWKDKDDASPGDLKRWACIDNIYCRVIQLFDEAAVDHGHFLITTDNPTDRAVLWGSERPTSTPRQDNRIPSNSRRVFDGDRTANWLEKLSEVLPLFVTHHRGRNISRITHAKYRDSLRAYVRVVDDIGGDINLGHVPGLAVVHPRVASSDYSWYERACFSLIALLIQCDSTTVVSIFTDTNTDIEFNPTALRSVTNKPIRAARPDAALKLERISECYVGAFLFQAVLCIKLHLDAAYSSMPESARASLLAPTLPDFGPRTTSSYSYYSARSFMRPWLRHGLAGTPLVGLSSTIGHAWVGYCTDFHLERFLPMYLELRTAPPPPHNEDPDRMRYFHGEGHDGVDFKPFTISGWCDAWTGVVHIINANEVYQWEWNGMLTPFGMVGLWGRWDGGWWWIWPQEWSPTKTRYN